MERLKNFRAGVIQVGRYAPSTHAPLFGRALRALPTGFDLVTFPEAFLPLGALGETLRRIGRQSLPTFIHVGLRRDAVSAGHLISVREMIAFVDELQRDRVVLRKDVNELRSWLTTRSTDALYNFGCVFGVDANNALRVCLHPKVVRSKWEEGALQHEHMTEANLLSIVVLDPTDRDEMPVYVQPLLCSDALVLPMDQPANHHPLLAITSRAAAFQRSVEHVDVVSVASCTRQSSDTYPDGELKQQWQQEFLDSARHIAEKDDARSHHGAIMLKANYSQVDGLPNAGLSGFFFPHALQDPRDEPHIHQSAYAKARSQESRWLAHREVDELRGEWQSALSRGYVIAVADAATQASLLAFEVTRLSRAARGWGNPSRLRNVRVSDLVPGSGAEPDFFIKRGT